MVSMTTVSHDGDIAGDDDADGDKRFGDGGDGDDIGDEDNHDDDVGSGDDDDGDVDPSNGSVTGGGDGWTKRMLLRIIPCRMCTFTNISRLF